MGRVIHESISVFGRIRPPDVNKKRRHGTGDYEVVETKEGPLIRLKIPKNLSAGYVNNQLVNRMFPFTGVLGMETTQDEVFKSVAMPVITDALDGYNGTIFAYGQTGSGKTFTITGGPEKYENRGIIPRAITRIFQDISSKREQAFTVRISYLEIYNGIGYDLLDPSHENTKLADLPKVKMMEDEYGNFRLRNISTLPVATEEEALNLLFVGDTNRMICETPNNDTSSRSHCIFTVHLEGRMLGSDSLKKSKLHMVDLAGSERVSKTSVDGTVLGEAIAINLSLHFLERVIVALHQKSRGKSETHIPYRDSMITSFLKDSLGGNCRTVMIAALSMDIKSLDETISTMRFAQRVGMIKNSATVNLSMDPDAVIKRLKLQVKQLEEENRILKGDADFSEALTEEQKEQCRSFCERYILPNASISLPTANPKQVEVCYEVLKNMILTEAPGNGGIGKAEGVQKKEDEDEDVLNLREQLKIIQRSLKEKDNEIRILVGLLKKYKKGGKSKNAWLSPKAVVVRAEETPKSTRETEPKFIIQEDVSFVGGDPKSINHDDVTFVGGAGVDKELCKTVREKTKSHSKVTSEEIMVKRHEAFVKYRETYKHNKSINSKKEALRAKFDKAKKVGREVNQARAKINAIKLEIEQHRAGRAASLGQSSDEFNSEDFAHAEQQLLNLIGEEKMLYKKKYSELKAMKAEIEHMKHLMETARRKLQLDFEAYWINKLRLEKENAALVKTVFISTSKQLSPDEKSSIHWGSVRKRPDPIGDPEVDKEVMKFYQTRDSILKEAWN